jgi:hypothetical protein
MHQKDSPCRIRLSNLLNPVDGGINGPVHDQGVDVRDHLGKVVELGRHLHAPEARLRQEALVDIVPGGGVEREGLCRDENDPAGVKEGKYFENCGYNV